MVVIVVVVGIGKVDCDEEIDTRAETISFLKRFIEENNNQRRL